MAEQEMLLDNATIKAAVAGEKWATEKVIEHYAPMIDELAVDEDMNPDSPTELLNSRFYIQNDMYYHRSDRVP